MRVEALEDALLPHNLLRLQHLPHQLLLLFHSLLNVVGFFNRVSGNTTSTTQIHPLLRTAF